MYTNKEAQIAAELERQLHRDNSLTAGKIIFMDYFKTCYETFRKGKMSWQNDRDIEISIKVVGRFFEGIKIKDIDRTLYQQFLNDYGKDHATATVKKYTPITQASMLLYQNVNIKYVSGRLGHTEIVTILQTYGYILNEMEQRESAHVNELMEKIYG